MASPGAILVLGARLSPSGAPTPALVRRLRAAAEAARGYPEARVVVCGGRRWHGHVEADVMASELERLGVPSSRIVRERLSLTTLENLREGSLLARVGPDGTLALVTCAWHLPRALAIAEAMRLRAVGIPAHPPPERLVVRLPRAVREAVMARIDARIARRARGAA